MIKKRRLLLIITLFLFSILWLKPALAIGPLINSDQLKNPKTVCDFLGLVTNASDILVGLTGILAVVMYIWGGFWLLTSYGGTRVQKGKDTIIAATVGIFIVMLAWTLVNTIIAATYGGKLTSSAFSGITGSDQWNVTKGCE